MSNYDISSERELRKSHADWDNCEYLLGSGTLSIDEAKEVAAKQIAIEQAWTRCPFVINEDGQLVRTQP